MVGYADPAAGGPVVFTVRHSSFYNESCSTVNSINPHESTDPFVKAKTSSDFT